MHGYAQAYSKDAFLLQVCQDQIIFPLTCTINFRMHSTEKLSYSEEHQPR